MGDHITAGNFNFVLFYKLVLKKGWPTHQNILMFSCLQEILYFAQYSATTLKFRSDVIRAQLFSQSVTSTKLDYIFKHASLS